jgi:hypothetical protein
MIKVNGSHTTTLTAAELCEKLPSIVRAEFGAHPFAGPLDRARVESLLPEYLAMSQAFPYLQASAQKEVVFDAIAQNSDISPEHEVTCSVGNFLSWDECGGHNVMLRYGKPGLPKILDTGRWYHANILRKDAAKILGRPVRPHYGPATQRYLRALHQGLASTDVVRRCAHMVAFELHASIMIESLGSSISTATGIPRAELLYFELHIGGADPAEKYHVEMTQGMVERVVPPSEHERFIEEFRRAYAVSSDWCRALVQQPRVVPVPAAEVWHQGGCHCGGVRFQVRAPSAIRATRCNCSICDMTGFLHLLVPAERFNLLSGEELLTTYQFNQRIAKHTFCKNCGVKAFYRPRSNPRGWSVNVRCLDRSTVESLEISEFDGQRWEESIHALEGREEVEEVYAKEAAVSE